MSGVKRTWAAWAAIVIMSVVAGRAVRADTGTTAAGVAPSTSPDLSVRPADNDGHQLLGAKGKLPDRQSIYAFLTAAKQAEALSDPLQRCLKYPDPPGSHWSAATVDAYCRYRLYQVTPYEEVRGLLQRGEFDELERRLSALLQEKWTQPGSRNNFDHSFETWFGRSDLELRTLLENWKRAKPQSAFAYAASGGSYMAMAMHARGGEFIRNTPSSQIEAMDRLLKLADADLRAAIKLDARLTPAYVSMISIGPYEGDDTYLAKAGQAALRADPANFAAYDDLMWALQPKWGGSLEQMTRLGKLARKHAAENPLLLLLPEKELAYEAELESDDCSNTHRFELYSVIFDQAAVVSQLLTAGTSAAKCNHLELSILYYSEALRFYPGDEDTRIARANQLTEFDESAWALKEVEQVLKSKPHDAHSIFSHGFVSESLNDYSTAEKDYLQALALDPGNRDIYAQLVQLYLDDMHDWEKAWKIDERVIELFPNDPFGWLVRASIQERQPRPGLKETADYFQAHFDTAPELHQQLLRMRAAQALQEGNAKVKSKTASP